MGFIEWELCKRLGKFPHEIYQARKINPSQMKFLELALINEINRRKKQEKELERKAKMYRRHR